MSVTKILTNEDGSAGRDKEDLDPVPELVHYIPAEEWNNVKRAAVETTEAIGVGDGTTEGSLAEVASRGLANANAASRFIERDDFNPVKSLFTYTGGTWVTDTDAVSDVGGEGFGVKTIEATAAAVRDAGAMVAGGASDLVVRARFRITSTVANMTLLRIGLRSASAFLMLGLGSNDFVAAFSDSTAGGGSTVELESATTLVINTWYAAEVRVDWEAKTIELIVDGVTTGPVSAVLAIPELTEDLGMGYEMTPASGTGSCEIDYIEIEGKRL